MDGENYYQEEDLVSPVSIKGVADMELKKMNAHPDNDIFNRNETGFNIQGSCSENEYVERASSTGKKRTSVSLIFLDPENKTNNNILGATFVLMKTCIGSSMFTFQVRCKHFGLLWFDVFIVVGVFLNIWSLLRMVQVGKRTNIKDYSDIVQSVLGKRSSVVLNVALGVTCLVNSLCYVVLIYQLIGRFIYSVFYNTQYSDFTLFENDIWHKAYLQYPITFGYCLLIFFLCLIKDIAKLNFAGYAGIFAILYNIVIIIIDCPKYFNYYKDNIYKEEDIKTHANYFEIKQAFTSRLHFFKGLATIFNAFACHNNLYPVYDSFSGVEGGDRKMYISLILSQIFVCILQCICVSAAFLTDPITPSDFILFRENRFGGLDIPMNIAKLSQAICLFFSTPLYYYTFRLTVERLFFKDEIGKISNIIIAAVTLSVYAFVSCIYDKILNYINYVGGFIVVLYIYLFPILLWVKNNGRGVCLKNALELGLALILVAMGWFGGVLTILDDINGRSDLDN